MTTPDRAALLAAGKAYLDRWSTWLEANPGASEADIDAAMQRGDPPPDASPVDETAVTTWADSYPAAHRVYWQIRASLQERDGRSRAHHHRIAVLAIHDAFPSRPDRARLGLPATALELAALLGVTDRVLRKYKVDYAAIFNTTRATIRDTFLSVYYGRVFEALGETAATQGRDGAADRRLFVQLTGDLGPKGGEDDPLHTVGMTLDEWRTEQERRRLAAEAQTAETLDIFEDE
jgi:hypothetical protein